MDRFIETGLAIIYCDGIYLKSNMDRFIELHTTVCILLFEQFKIQYG